MFTCMSIDKFWKKRSHRAAVLGKEFKYMEIRKAGRKSGLKQGVVLGNGFIYMAVDKFWKK